MITAFPKIFAIGTDYIVDLFQDEVEITEKVDGCFTYETPITLSDGSKKTIGEIVNKKLPVEVLSYDEEKNIIVKKKVVNWFKHDKTEDWLKIKVQGFHGEPLTLKCTYNHRIFTNNGWKKAIDISDKDTILYFNKYYEPIQEEILLGCLLGDASVSCGRICFAQGEKQLTYLKSKYLLFNNMAAPITKYKTGYGKSAYRFSLYSNPIYDKILPLTFIKKKKTITKGWLNKLTPVSLAFWYMDDGHFNTSSSQYGYACFHTEGFSEKENDLIVSILNKKFNLSFKKKKYSKYCMLTLDTENTKKLFTLIFPYVVPSLQYKLSSEFRTNINIYQNLNTIKDLNKLQFRKVIKIEKFIPTNKYRYDIEVEDTHTFLVNGLVVHNSQWVFGKIDGTLYMRSKGCIQYAEKHDNLFKEAVDYVVSIEDKIPDNTIFYCEYLKKPKHNTLKYDRVPKNNLILFGVCTPGQKFVSKYEDLLEYGRLLDIEVVPLIYQGTISNPEELLKMLDRESCLGGCKIEGVVVKNYNKPFLLGGQPIPLMAGKYVSEAFKEVHRKSWSKENTGKGKWDTFKEGYKTEARWEKAIQHYKEKGLYTGTPKDIGGLMKEIQEDIKAEEMDIIKNFLWKEFGQEVLRTACSGFPEWFKTKILKDSFNNEG